MARRAALGICSIALLATVAVAPARAKEKPPEANAPCTQATFQNIFLDITSWTDVNTYPAGTAAKSLPNLAGLAPGGTATLKVDICRVAFTIDTYIDVEVWLPTTGWNGKLQGVGNGGLAGSISYSNGTVGGDLITATSLGYAAVATDTGHISNCGNPCPPPIPVTLGNSWWTNPPQLKDNGYLAIHEMTVKAKAFTQKFYNQAPKHSYFNACSTGGREGFMEAQRYPKDYDGIVTGSPVFHVLHLRSRHVWTWQCNWQDPSGASAIPFATTTFNGTTYRFGKLTTIYNAVVNKCQGQDGLNDGLVWDPRACHFDPVTIQCPAGTDNVTCLTPKQVETLRCMYRGPGEDIYPGVQMSSELDNGQSIGTVPNPQYTTFFQYTVFWNVLDQNGAPAFDFRTFTFPDDVNYTVNQIWGGETMGSIQEADSPDLTEFEKNGGKWIIYHPTADPLPSAVDTIHYYNSVRDFFGFKQPEKTQDFVRLFLVPNGGHCLGTNPGGPTNIDPLTALDNWIENGVAPDQLIGSNAASTYSRPICHFPLVTQYSGQGSTSDASSFKCVQGPDWQDEYWLKVSRKESRK